MPLIDELEAKAAQLRGELDKVKAQIRAEQVLIVKKEYGVEIGTVVKNKSRSYRITDIRWTSKGRKPWVSGMWIRKDGTRAGTYPTQLYDDWNLEIAKEDK